MRKRMSDQQIACVWGISGQVAPFVAKQLLDRGWKVHGVFRRNAQATEQNLPTEILCHPNFALVEADLTDQGSIDRLVQNTKYDWMIGLAAQSFVAASFVCPEMTIDTTGIGVLRILEALRKFSPATRFYQASSSEMFGLQARGATQDENTPLVPRSPYGAAKILAHHLCRVYREAYGMWIACGIAENHESERRGKKFVTRKITDYVAQYYYNVANGSLELGNWHATRDWSYAGDVASAIIGIMELPQPDDFVICTGLQSSVQDFCNEAFAAIGVRLRWDDRECYNVDTGELVIKVNPAFYRPAEVPNLKGDFAKLYRATGWYPKTVFKDLVQIMVKNDIAEWGHKLGIQPESSDVRAKRQVL